MAESTKITLLIVVSVVVVACVAGGIYYWKYQTPSLVNSGEQTQNFADLNYNFAATTYAPQTVQHTTLTNAIAVVGISCFNTSNGFNPSNIKKVKPVNGECPPGSYTNNENIQFTQAQIVQVEQFAALMRYPTAAEILANDKSPNPAFYTTYNNFLVDEITAGRPSFTATVVGNYILYLKQLYPGVGTGQSPTINQMITNATNITGQNAR